MFKHTINCPHCGESITKDWSKYIAETDVDENRAMGSEIEYSIECDALECVECKKIFKVSGSVWEYPEGACNDHELCAYI